MGSLRLPIVLRRWWAWVLAALVLVAVLLTGRAVDLDDVQRTAIPVPSPVYAIEATSNGHTASILNLGITPVGVPQVPTPVDVDGDLLPDVTVAVNLVDVQGVHNPPDLGDIVAPNIEINRFPLELGTTLLGRPSPPLRINVRFDINDLEGQEDPMHVRFGYDTGSGGSIPGFYQATLKGIDDFFNPVEADISTKGDLITQSPQPTWYEGPLTVIGGFEQGALKADLGLEFAPFPDEIGVRFEHGADGAHIDYRHALAGDVDLAASLDLQDGPERTTVDTRIERLPREVDVDIADGTDGGGITFDTDSDGRLADVDARVRGALAGDVFDAHMTIEDLPSHMEAEWAMPEDGSALARFDSSGQGIGAIEAHITNKGDSGGPQGLPPFAFAEQQFVAVQHNAATDGLRVGGRLERIRSAELTSTPDGAVDARVNVGDGELPLEIDGFLDLRDDDAPLIEANAVISPLPGDIRFRITPPGDDGETEPMVIRYDAAEGPDIDGAVKLQEPDAAGSACGDAGVLCGDLRIRHVPTSVETRIGDFVNDDGDREARIEVDAQGVDKPDLFADVSIGPDPATEGGKPLVAHAEILALTEIARIRTVEGKDDTLERAEFHTCDFDYVADECVSGTEDRIGALAFSIANFAPGDRPSDLPPAYAATPNFTTIVARGRDHGRTVDFEATGRMTDIQEVTYVNDGAFGVRTDIGGGKPLAAIVDIDDIRFEEAPDLEDTEFFDITGDVLIDPLPEVMSFCLNASGQDVVAPTSTITAECQQANPFNPDGDPLAKSPLSVAYDGSSQFDVTADAELHALGVEGSDDRDDRRIRGHLEVLNIPKQIRAHILDPEDGEQGPTLVDIDAPLADTGAEQVDVIVGAQLLDADLQCQDPRVPDSGHSAVCASGRIENLPTHLSLEYDPEAESDNFVLDSAGPEQLDLQDLSVSSVQRDDDTNRAQVLIAEGKILDLPRRVEGTLSLPAPEAADGPVAVDLVATPPLGTIEAEVRNFVAPDPIGDMPAQRQGLPAPDDYASFIQRGDAFKAKVKITSVKRVGFRNQVTDDGTRLDTSVVNVDFGIDKNIRGYVDLDVDGTDRLIGDVTLADVPAGLQVCFRGPKEEALAELEPAAGTATFCDDNPDPDADDDDERDVPDPQTRQGAVELRMEPNAPARELDIDGFVRHATGGGADVVAARLDVDNIPNVVAGTFGDGRADIGGYRLDGTPEGIDRISVHAASFDLPDDGWTDANRPYPPRFVTRAPFPAPLPSIQHVAVRADDNDFEVRARIGEVEPSATPASDLHRVRLGSAPCQRPAPVDYDNGLPLPDYGARPDFPFMPYEPDPAEGEEVDTYTCIRADFEPVGPSTVDPLDLSAIIDKGGQRIALRDAGLDDIPEFFQINLADVVEPTQDVDGQPRLRPHCVGTSFAQPDNCIAPMVRVDTPGNSSLFGVVEVGSVGDVAALDSVVPRETIPLPLEPQGWAASENGVRARIGQFEDRSVIKAGVRIPIPASFTVDQVQSWGISDNSSQDTFYEASDLHFRYAARNKDGSTQANLGRLSAMIHSFTDGSQVLISDDDPSQGFEVPGELGLDLFVRDFSGKGRSFMQVDGRNSAQDFDMRARVLGGAGEDAFGRLDAQIRNVPALASLAYSPSTTPTFRLRTEVMGEGKAPPDPDSSPDDAGGPPPKEDSCSPLLCVETQVRLESVNAQFDFEPTVGAPARRIEAAIRTDGAKNGVEVRGFSTVGGDTPAKFLAGAQLSVDPINIFLHAGIPFLGSLDFVMLSDLDAAVSLGGEFGGFSGSEANATWPEAFFGPADDSNVPTLSGPGTDYFQLKQNLLHMKLDNGIDGTSGTSRLGPIDFTADVMHGEAWALFVKLIGIDFIPPGDTLRIPFLNCNAGGIAPNGLNSIAVPGGGDRNVVAWPFFPAELGGNIYFSGVLKPFADLAGSIGGPFFCLVDTDQELMFDGSEKVHPADPLGTELTGSTVPDAIENPDDLPVDVTPPAPTGALFDFPPSGVTLPATLEMCGTFTFDDVQIPSGKTVKVATANNNLDIRGLTEVADDDFPAACPNGATLGELQIVAAGSITVDGSINANAISTRATNATGNGGGGHGANFPFVLPDFGKGGRGGHSGVGGPPVGGEIDNPLGADAGTAGSTVAGGGTAGKGGGIIKLLADVLDVNAGGSVVANGNPGGNVGSVAQCSSEGDPDDPDDDVPNTGVAGGGAGAGGGIVISVADLQNGGTISAAGGKGGTGSKGGGGGGGGGVLKLSTALKSGNAVSVAGGPAGTSLCPADNPVPVDGAGQVGWLDQRLGARSKIDISEAEDFGFWHSTQDRQELILPWEAAAQPNPADDYQVTVCHTVLLPSLVQDGKDLGSQLLGYPSGLSDATLYRFNGLFFEEGSPCGTPTGVPDPIVAGPEMLNSVEIDGTRTTGTISANPQPPVPFTNELTEGYHGFWTILWKTDTPGNDCFDPSDFGGGLAGIQFDLDHCRPEDPPATPDVVLGIDNSNPNVHSISVNGTPVTDGDGVPTGAEPVPSGTPDIQMSFVDTDNLSKVTGIQCTPNATTEDDLADCTSGQIVRVEGGDGTKSIGIRVTDGAGNTDLFTADVSLDTTIPTSQGEIVAGSATAGENGWYLSSPSYRLFGFDDGTGSGPGVPPYEYQFDDGDVRPCPDLDCAIDGSAGHELPGIGRHALRWTGIDAVGNRQADEDRGSISVKVDDELPISELLTVPKAPNGANDWFSGPTWVSFGAFDQPGASGFDLTEGDATETDDIGGVFYTHNGGPLVAFDPLEPLRLDPGLNTVCWYASDIAGNVEAERCREFKVDEADPTSNPFTTGGTIGDADWFTASPSLRTQVVDGGTSGSGVDNALAPTDVLCGQRPLIADPAPSGTCISIDGAPFLPIDAAKAAFTLGEGLHEVRVFSTDRAGRRSAIATDLYQVDLSGPVAHARTITPQPSRGRWHRNDATVVLRAADGDRHGSGVTGIRYQVVPGTSSTCTSAGNGFTAYDGPFTVPQGVYTVRYWSVDASGRTGPCRTLPVAVDHIRPVPKANPNAVVWLRLELLGIPLSNQTTNLKWTLQEELSGSVGEKVNVEVIVYDVLGYPVRHLNAGQHLVLPGQTLAGQVAWDGKVDGLLGYVPLGTYHYRVVATDAAGNPAMSGESGALVIVRVL